MSSKITSIEIASKYKERKEQKDTNNTKLPNYYCNFNQFQPTFGHHKLYPISIKKTEKELNISIGKKYKNPIPLNYSIIVICLYDQCKNKSWGK